MAELGTARMPFVFAAARAYFCLAAKVAKRRSARSLGDLLFSCFGNEKNSPAAQTAFHFFRNCEKQVPACAIKARRRHEEACFLNLSIFFRFPSCHKSRNLLPLIWNVS